MRTEVYVVSRDSEEWTEEDRDKIDSAAALIRNGHPVAIPTETVYGLAANALHAHAVEQIFAVKGRPADNPLIVHVGEQAQVNELAEPLSQVEQRLIELFWPGPLTLVLKAKPAAIPDVVRAGLDTVAVRQPKHPVALAIIRASGVPLAAPSANLSGRPSPTKAEHVLDDFLGNIAAVVDGGPTADGIESTVVRYMDDALYILRAGTITAEMLMEAVGSVCRVISEEDVVCSATPRSPGVKYTHYAPRGEMTVVDLPDQAQRIEWIQRTMREAALTGHKTGLLTFADDAPFYRELVDVVLVAGVRSEPEQLAEVLYDCLRRFDREQVTFIVAEACPAKQVGAAVMNRLLKAAGGRMVRDV